MSLIVLYLGPGTNGFMSYLGRPTILQTALKNFKENGLKLVISDVKFLFCPLAGLHAKLKAQNSLTPKHTL